MSIREQHLADLVAARDRLDRHIHRIVGPAPEPPIWHPPVPHVADDADRADVARGLIWAGWTHAQVAASLGIGVDDIAGLIAPPRTMARVAA